MGIGIVVNRFSRSKNTDSMDRQWSATFPEGSLGMGPRSGSALSGAATDGSLYYRGVYFYLRYTTYTAVTQHRYAIVTGC